MISENGYKFPHLDKHESSCLDKMDDVSFFRSIGLQFPLPEALTEDQISKLKSIGKECCTIFHMAALKNNAVIIIDRLLKLLGPEVSKELIKDKRQYGSTILHIATLQNNFTLVNTLLKHLDPETFKELNMYQDKGGDTALHLAASGGYSNLIDVLLTYLDLKTFKELIMKQNNNGNTPLHEAARRGQIVSIGKLIYYTHREVAERFIKAKNNNGNTASELLVHYLMHAKCNRTYSSIELRIHSNELQELMMEICTG